VKFVILDEADMMLSFGFEEDVETILQVPALQHVQGCAEPLRGHSGRGHSCDQMHIVKTFVQCRCTWCACNAGMIMCLS